MLTKTQMVLVLEFVEEQVAVEFSYAVEENPEDNASRNNRVHLDFEVWDSMGRPEVITVAVEPGDLLNAEKENEND